MVDIILYTINPTEVSVDCPTWYQASVSSRISVMSAGMQSSDCHTNLSISYHCGECGALVVILSHGLVNSVSLWWVWSFSRLTITQTCQSRINVMSAGMQSSGCHTNLSIPYQCDECGAAIVWLSYGLAHLASVWWVRDCSRLAVTQTYQSILSLLFVQALVFVKRVQPPT